MKNLIHLMTVVSMLSCSRKPPDVNHFDLTQVQSQDSIHLGDMMEIEDIVFLQTDSNCFVPRHFWAHSTEKNIIIRGNGEKVMQFSIDGKFIRNLMIEGKGPDEFYGLRASVADSRNEIYYYFAASDPKHIRRISLVSGKHLSAIPLSDSLKQNVNYINSMILKGDTLFCSVLHPMNSICILAFNTVTGKSVLELKRNVDRSSSSQPVITQPGNSAHFLEANGDTLFAVDHGNFRPVYSFEFREKFSSESVHGTNVSKMKEGNSFLLFETQYLTPQNAWDPMGRPYATYFLNKNTHVIKQVGQISIDSLEYAVEPRFIYEPLTIDGDRVIYTVYGGQVMKVIKRILNEEKNLSAKSSLLRKIDSTWNENDNPMFLIGRLK